MLCPLLILGCTQKADMTVLENVVNGNNPTFKGSAVSREARAQIEALLDEYKRKAESRIERKEELGLLYKSAGMKLLEIDAIKQNIEEREKQREGEFMPETLEQTGVFHEVLGVGFFEKRIYGDALSHFEKALEIFTENILLHHYAGVCSARLGKAALTAEKLEERTYWYSKAEKYYRRVIELDPAYAPALYGLAILLVYELDRLAEAEELLERLLAIERRYTEGYFLLAYVYYTTDRPERAIELYERVEESTPVKKKVAQARENRERIMSELYGAQ